MNIKTQILVIAAALAALIVLVNMIRNNKLELKYAMSWFVLGIGVLLFGCFPSLTSLLAGVFGIGTPVNMLFFAGFCFALIVIFSLTMAVSRLSNKVKKLAQELALLQKEREEQGACEKDEKTEE